MDRDRAAYRLPADLETAEIELVICTVDQPKLARMPLLDYRADRRHDLAQMTDRLAVLDTVVALVPFAHTRAQSQHHPAAAEPVDIERVLRGLHRTARECERDPRAELKPLGHHRGRGQRREWGSLQLRRPYAVETQVFEAPHEIRQLGSRHRLHYFPIIAFHASAHDPARLHTATPRRPSRRSLRSNPLVR